MAANIVVDVTLQTLHFLKLSKNILKWFLKAKPLHHKTISPSRFALVSSNKHFAKDSSFQVGCELFWNFNKRRGSAILINIDISNSS